jgi:hypothetical protein
LVHAAFERFSLPEAGPIVEMGAGLGELYGLLPDALRARWVLTEPTELGVRELLRRFPAARVERAEVERLPFADGEVAGLVGLCVLDLIPDLPRARAEVERVLCDRGVLLHFLDQNPHLARIFQRIVPLGLVVLPNVFGDPNESHFPEDLLLIEAEQLAEVALILRRHGQAQSEPLARYLALFTAKPLPLMRALAEFDHLASDDQRRTLVRHAFEEARRVATAEERARLGDLRGHLISSSQDLAGRFERELVSSELQPLYNNLSFACELVEASDSAVYQSGARLQRSTAIGARPSRLRGHADAKRGYAGAADKL